MGIGEQFEFEKTGRIDPEPSRFVNRQVEPSDFPWCEWCDEFMSEGDEIESTPGGGMHAECAREYEEEKPEDW